MDIPAAAAGPWIVLGVLLGLAGLIGFLVLRGRPSTPAADESPLPVAEDDLPGFLESPPGSAGAPVDPAQGWATLTAPPEPVAPPLGTPPSRWDTLRVLSALTLAGVLLIGIAAALAVVSRPEPGAGPGRDESADGVAADLAFGGVVLERRAVGVTATYPRVRLTSDDERTVAHLELPTVNCLTAEAPDDPVAAGCTPAGTEYADLATPALAVRRDGETVRMSGRFETYLRPNGSSPVGTGRVYELEITAESVGDASAGTWMPATGVLRLGDDRTTTADGTDDRLRLGR